MDVVIPLGMKILSSSRNKTLTISSLSQSDFLSMNCLLNEQTRHLIEIGEGMKLN